ncbi:MAG: hypothetical protein LBN02_08155 [Oscillospiraceae bacterium]|nr:hypothetical protein [Oscillospiraceae bacterium]
MTEKQFVYALRRGLGSAIVELKTNENRARYRDAVLRCCLRDINYDWQVEGTKGWYLYTAVCALGEKDAFEPIIIERFLSRCRDRLFLQLSSILACFADDGSDRAKAAFREKYAGFAAKNGRLANSDADEGFQWDDVASRLFCIDGFAAFKRYVDDIGNVLAADPENSKVYYDSHALSFGAEDAFGKKRVNDYMEKMYDKSDAVKALTDAQKRDALSAERHQEEIARERLTIPMLVEAAKGAVSAAYPRAVMPHFRFMKNASEDEIAELARTALAEEDETIKALLLSMFRRKPFPLDIAPLLQYARSDNELLSETSINLLESFSDARIHDLAVELLGTKGLSSQALGLLKENYRKSDDALINALIAKAAIIPHHVQMDICDIYRHHRSKDAFPALLRVYQRGECAFCRHGAVEAMHHCGVLPDEILNECLYDSYDDTRKYAKRRLARKR